MLTAVPRHSDTLSDAQVLLWIVEAWRPNSWIVVTLLIPALLGVGLLATGLPCGGLLVGAALSLALSRYGPRWWPGRR